jgi:phenylalanyl-tRNA synthetase beta chain
VVNYSFVSEATFRLTGPEDKKGVALLNPLSEDQLVMRDSLLPSLVETLRWNLARKNEDIGIFEIRPVFTINSGVPLERWKVGGLMYGLRQLTAWNIPGEALDFYDVKGVVERLMEGLGVEGSAGFSAVTGNPFFHPGRSACLVLKAKQAGLFGELHPDIQQRLGLKTPAFVFELDITSIVDAIGGGKVYGALPKYPESTRDIAFVVDEDIPYGEIISSIQGLDTKFIENVMLFDVYYGGNIPEGRRSMALRIVYRSGDRTLKYQEVEEMHSRVAKTITERFGAEIRTG